MKLATLLIPLAAAALVTACDERPSSSATVHAAERRFAVAGTNTDGDARADDGT